MNCCISVDLGKANIRAGVVNANFEIVGMAEIKSLCDRPAKDISDDIVRVCIEACEAANISVDDAERIGIAYNLDLKEVSIKKHISEHIKKPVYFANKVHSAAYGEFLAGAAKGASDAVCITLDTNRVGACVIIDGKIFTGRNLAGAEIGHMVIDMDGPPCSCGRKGCFEVFSSAAGLANMLKEAVAVCPETLMAKCAERDGYFSPHHAFEAMRAGDFIGRKVVDKYIKYLAVGIANVINIFQPEILCIGGEICSEGDALFVPLKTLVNEQIITKMLSKNAEIKAAVLGENAVIIGAAFLEKNKNGVK